MHPTTRADLYQPVSPNLGWEPRPLSIEPARWIPTPVRAAPFLRLPADLSRCVPAVPTIVTMPDNLTRPQDVAAKCDLALQMIAARLGLLAEIR